MPAVEIEVRSSALTPDEQARLRSTATMLRVVQGVLLVVSIGMSVMISHQMSAGEPSAQNDPLDQLPIILFVLGGAVGLALLQRTINNLRADADGGFANEHTGPLERRHTNKGTVVLRISGRRFGTQLSFMRKTPAHELVYRAPLPIDVWIRFAPASGTVLDVRAITSGAA